MGISVKYVGELEKNSEKEIKEAWEIFEKNITIKPPKEAKDLSVIVKLNCFKKGLDILLSNFYTRDIDFKNVQDKDINSDEDYHFIKINNFNYFLHHNELKFMKKISEK